MSHCSTSQIDLSFLHLTQSPMTTTAADAETAVLHCSPHSPTPVAVVVAVAVAVAVVAERAEAVADSPT